MTAGVAGAGCAVIVQGMAAGPSAPMARYVMDVSTTSGMAAMGGGMGGAMSMMFGGGDREARSIELRLGSSLSPTGGAPKADHFPPVSAKMGKALPLTSPKPATPGEPGKDKEYSNQFQKPKGRLLLYWGCGAKAGKGQPVIIDFSKLAKGQMPPNLFTTRVPTPDTGPMLTNSRTYGAWPGDKGGKQPTKASSLLGEHRVAGNYAPEIKFTLGQDFMPAINGKARDLPGGAADLSWNSVTNATGYYAWAMGAKDAGGDSADMVWWTSSAARDFGGGLWDWLPPETVRRLITEKVVMPPTQTSCTIPAEVKAASPGFLMGNLYAYGPEAHFAYPPRPANAAAAWKPEWTTRVRFRSNTSWLIGGPDMGAAMSGDDGAKPKGKKCKGGLGGILSGAIGAGC
ncbi:hypothetical protein [Sphingobium boeckii]|uniref:Uncharacterized protein n=1 Tax=Sphingobium boeckii TaxID=1082345 RepID=A0A7W9AGJ2_9SPHN|nr:hypothetical protein [Sphingobium boeckii]MBB5685215.1 hypothetical protein [Sphingobium boeckii]